MLGGGGGRGGRGQSLVSRFQTRSINRSRERSRDLGDPPCEVIYVGRQGNAISVHVGVCVHSLNLNVCAKKSRTMSVILYFCVTSLCVFEQPKASDLVLLIADQAAFLSKQRGLVDRRIQSPFKKSAIEKSQTAGNFGHVRNPIGIKLIQRPQALRGHRRVGEGFLAPS